MDETDSQESSGITDNTEIDDETLEQLDGSLEHPTFQAKDNIFKFFRDILKLKRTTKVGFLTKEETGKSILSMRSYLELANYGKAEGLTKISDYFLQRAEILSATSMGREGNFLKTSVTQIKKDQKIQTAQQQEKKKLWGNRPQQPQGEPI